MHRTCLKWWREKIGDLRLADFTPAVLVEYRNKLGRETYIRAMLQARRTSLKSGEASKEFTRSNASVNRYLACLSHVVTVARKEWHWAVANPFDGVSKLRESGGRVRYLTEEERTRLLAETIKDETLHTLVILALSTAARAGELLQFSWREVDFIEGRLFFRVTKNSQPRAVWIQGEALALLMRRSDNRASNADLVFQGVGGKGIYDYKKVFSNAVASAGLADFRFHDLRHSAATYLAIAGATEQQLRAIGGWKSNVISRYVQTDSKDILLRTTKAILKMCSRFDIRLICSLGWAAVP